MKDSEIDDNIEKDITKFEPKIKGTTLDDLIRFIDRQVDDFKIMGKKQVSVSIDTVIAVLLGIRQGIYINFYNNRIE